MKKSLMFISIITSCVLLTSCCYSGRDISSPSKACIGHWQNKKGKLQHYVSEKKLIQLTDKGSERTYSYRICMENKQKRVFVLKINNSDEYFKITFDKDYKTLKLQSTLTKYEPTDEEVFDKSYWETSEDGGKYTYIDEKTSPAE